MKIRNSAVLLRICCFVLSLFISISPYSQRFWQTRASDSTVEITWFFHDHLQRKRSTASKGSRLRFYYFVYFLRITNCNTIHLELQAFWVCSNEDGVFLGDHESHLRNSIRIRDKNPPLADCRTGMFDLLCCGRRFNNRTIPYHFFFFSPNNSHSS